MTNFIVRVAIVLGFIFLGGWIFTTIWNGCLIPAVPGLKEIGILQGIGILALSHMLFDSKNIVVKNLSKTEE